jgi:hypothetical protein
MRITRLEAVATLHHNECHLNDDQGKGPGQPALIMVRHQHKYASITEGCEEAVKHCTLAATQQSQQHDKVASNESTKLSTIQQERGNMNLVCSGASQQHFSFQHDTGCWSLLQLLLATQQQ